MTEQLGWYEVWLEDGPRRVYLTRLRSLSGAIQFASYNNAMGEFAIKYPNGEWHKWES